MTQPISAVVEGDVDAAIIRRLAIEAKIEIGNVHVKGGKQNVRSRINGYNHAARQTPFVVLVDLDREYECAPQLVKEWVPTPESLLLFRVAVRAVESWLLADGDRAARFLRVRRADIPSDPEAILDPKRTLVDLARRSSSRDVRSDLVPRPGSGRSVGVAYSARLSEFISTPSGWRPDVAAERCDSLSRALESLTAFAVLLRMVEG